MQMTDLKRRIPIAIGLSAAIAAAWPAHADTYSSGSGFFVNRDGYVVTNNHVIAHCGQIAVAGAVNLANATLVARDEQYDLALLKTDAMPTDAASLSSDKQPLHADDPVTVVGFPGQSWKTLELVTREAHVMQLHGPGGEEKWLEFSDAIALGNSGGPLLDASGNVVGVVVAKGKLYARDADAARDELISQFDLAISLPVLRKFLDGQGVLYREADSGIYFSSDRITDLARHFVVNVRCRVVE